MGEYGWDIRERAEEHYVLNGHTYEAVARLTGVSLSQLKRWGKDAAWTDKRRAYRADLSVIRRGAVTLRKKVLETALEKTVPQNVYAVAALEKALRSTEAGQSAAPSPPPVSGQRFETPAEAVSALEEAVQRKVGEMVAGGGSLDLAGIKNMKEALELLEQMKVKYNPDTKQEDTGGLSDEEADNIRRQILGISG